MEIFEFEIPDVKLIVSKRFSDARGFFSQIWSDRQFREEIADVAFVQDNPSVSARKVTLRGLNFQKPPFAQGKLIRVEAG
jgi:dTDP-4-dehydrorhamnose 3,5-epimerase